MGRRKRRLAEKAVVVVVEQLEEEPEVRASSSSSSPPMETTPAKVVKRTIYIPPKSFLWNPVVNIEVDQKTGNVSHYLTDFHLAGLEESVKFRSKKEVDSFLANYWKRSADDKVKVEVVSTQIIYSRDNFNKKWMPFNEEGGEEVEAEAGTLICPILDVLGIGLRIRCLILESNVFTLGEKYELKRILRMVPNLTYFSIKCEGDLRNRAKEVEDRDGGNFPRLGKLKWVEIVTHFYCGLAKEFLEEYGGQLIMLTLQDLDCQKYAMTPGSADSLNEMVKGLGEIEGMLGNVKELKICSLRNLAVLSSLTKLNPKNRWNLKKLAVNVTQPNEDFKFCHWQNILNCFAGSLEEAHLDVFGHRTFEEGFFGWKVVKGQEVVMGVEGVEKAKGLDYPEECLPRKVCEKVKVLSLPSLVLIRYGELKDMLKEYFPGVESIRLLRWERKWPMKVEEYKGRPNKCDLERIWRKIKAGLPNLVEVKVLRRVEIESDEDIVYLRRFEKTKKTKY